MSLPMNAVQQTIALLLVSLFLAGCMDAVTPEADAQEETEPETGGGTATSDDTSGATAGTTVVNNYLSTPTMYYRNGVANITGAIPCIVIPGPVPVVQDPPCIVVTVVATTIHQNAGEWIRIQELVGTSSASWQCTGYPDMVIHGADCDIVLEVSSDSDGLYGWSVVWTVQPVVAG